MCMYVGFRVVCMADCRCVCVRVGHSRVIGSELKVVQKKSHRRIST